MEYMIQSETLTGIADAIRGKTGGSAPISVPEMAEAISGIQSGEYVVGLPVAFTLEGWDPELQGTTYTLVCVGYKIGEGGLQIGLMPDSPAVNAQAVVAAALSIVDTSVSEPSTENKTAGSVTVTINAVNAPDRDLTIALFGLEAAEPVPVTEAAIVGLTPPAAGAAPVTSLTENAQYTGAVSWSPEISGGAFAASTAYTAAITLTAKVGYTMQGVTANLFTVAGASGVSNAADSGVVTAVFPATGEVTA